jgi:hypothetical protein
MMEDRLARRLNVGRNLLLLVVASTVAGGQTPPQSPFSIALTEQTKPDQVKDLLLRAVFTSCSIPGSSKPTMFIYRNRDQSWARQLVEIRDPWNSLVPIGLDEADRLNGIQFRAWLIVDGASVRQFDFHKREWKPWGSNPDIRRVTTAALNGNKDARWQLFAGIHWGAAAVSMKRENGRWSFRFENDGGGPLDPDAFSAEKLSCGEAMSGPSLPKE